jgi:hypothetical protein
MRPHHWLGNQRHPLSCERRVPRAAVVRRSEWTRSSVGERRRTRRPPSAKRSERSEQSNTEIARRRAEPGWRAAVLDEVSEQTRSSVCERMRKAAASRRQPQRAERAMCTERAETLFLCERRRSRRVARAIARAALNKWHASCCESDFPTRAGRTAVGAATAPRHSA